jgi:hypothetical protein
VPSDAAGGSEVFDEIDSADIATVSSLALFAAFHVRLRKRCGS